MTAARVLLIKDDPDILRILKLELQEAGYRVSTAESVMQGLTSD
ncbi:hypothetical protein [Deinococcus sonorensis]|uniref:Response regulatory domain-containing protein n=2 Tax=Deinococcus sonorensis TaxID=309891 RepID=A0AAU7U640_9DEIO